MFLLKTFTSYILPLTIVIYLFSVKCFLLPCESAGTVELPKIPPRPSIKELHKSLIQASGKQNARIRIMQSDNQRNKQKDSKIK